MQAGANQINLFGQRGDGLVREGQPRASAAIRAGTGRLEGQVTTPDGKPLRGKRHEPVGVQLVLRRPGQAVYLRPTQLDAAGFYEARDLNPGKYQLEVGEAYVADERFPPRTLREVEVRASEVGVLDLVVTRKSVTARSRTRIALLAYD